MHDAWWNREALADLSDAQWEQLCDGCGQCCLHTLQDDYTEKFVRTAVHCRYLDPLTCRCRDYPNRTHNVPDCMQLDAASAARFNWLPDTCAYRLRAAGRPLPEWHPLESGDPLSVVRAGVSVRGRVVSEEHVSSAHLEEYVLHWIDEED